MTPHGAEPDAPSRRRDRGTATAELAIGLLGLVLVLAAVLDVAVVAQRQLQCADAARAGARAAARGEPSAVVGDLARRLAGADAGAAVTSEGPMVTVQVTTAVRLLLPGVPPVRVSAAASVPAEAGIAP